jgi:hypothetical protein
VTAYKAALLLHILLLVYWLGADLGVFYSSRWVLRSCETPAARAVALRIMHFLDFSPRLALVLFLPSGVTLMANDEYGRDTFAGWPLVLVWAASAAWLVLVYLDYERPGFRHAVLVKRLDLMARFCLVSGLLTIAVYTMLADHPFGAHTNPKWLGAKVALYAIAIGCGIGIRFQLRPFGPAWGELQSTGSTPDVERRLRGAINGAIPWVTVIWACVLGAAALGVFKPGANL